MMRRAVLVAALLGAWAVDAPADGGGKVTGLLEDTDRIAAEVAKLRGLKVKKTIKRGIKSKQDIRMSLLENLERDTTTEEIAAEERMLKRLGMLAADADYKALFVDLATEQIAGFYDPWEKELYIAEGIDLGGAGGFEDGPPVMAHEIDHALQDQHFDLRSFMDAAGKDNGDAMLARQALVEGDGMAIMIEYMFARFGGDPPWGDPRVTNELEAAFDGAVAPGSDLLSKAPLFMQVGMLFPYTGGLRFIMRYRRHHSWKRIDKMFARPPLSTEHILHPKKYSSYERPHDIAIKTVASLDGMKEIYRNVNGELGLAVVLRQHGVDADAAEVATDGWGGDRMALYAPSTGDDGKPGSSVAVLYTTWDAVADAIEFFDAAVPAVETLAAGKAVAESDKRAAYTGAGGEAFTIERSGDTVVIIVGADSVEAADAIAADVRKHWTVKRR
jgi:hypothetical protein